MKDSYPRYYLAEDRPDCFEKQKDRLYIVIKPGEIFSYYGGKLNISNYTQELQLQNSFLNFERITEAEAALLIN